MGAPRVHEFHWKPVWVMVVQPFGGALLASLLGAQTVRHGKLRVHLCSLCEERAASARLFAGLSVCALLLGMLVPVLVQSLSLLAVMMPIGIVGALAMQFGVVFPRTVRALRIDDDSVTLENVHPRVIAALDARKPNAG